MSTFDRLREERVRLGMSQSQFAQLGQIVKQTQVHYESGKRHPDDRYLAAIAAAGADVLYIVTGERNPGIARTRAGVYNLEARNPTARIVDEPTPSASATNAPEMKPESVQQVPKAGSITTLIADDHEMILSGFKGILQPHDITVSATTIHPELVIELFEVHRPSVVVLDARFNGKESGLVVCKDLKTKHPDARVIIYSQFEQLEHIKAAYSMGALAFVTKAQPIVVLIEAIFQANLGKVYVPPKIGEILLHSAVTPTEAPLESRLNERELGVFRLMASGRSLGEIATEMELSLKTVSVSSQSVKDKLGVHNAVQMAHLAIKHGLIEPMA